MAGRPGRSGGRRKGQAGKQYPNRSDMRQPAKAAPNQTYGQAGQQIKSQQQQPLPSAASGMAPSPSMGAPEGGAPQPPIVGLGEPTARPMEPITAGLASGPGPGPEALNLPPQPSEDQNLSAFLHGIYQAYPNPDLARLIASLESK